MKTDYEMTKSLIRRRDEYMAAKRKKAALKLIPRTLVPLVCMAAVIISVMTLNGVFAPPKVDVSLVPGNSNISALENLASQSPFATTAGEDDGKVSYIDSVLASLEAALTDESSDPAKWEESSDWVYAAEIMNAIKNGDEVIESDADRWHFELSNIPGPQKIVESGIVYSLILPVEGAYEDLGFDTETARIYCDPLPAAVLYEVVNDSEEASESKYVFGSFYKIAGMEGYLALINKEGFLLYQAEKWATFIVNDTNYYTHLALSGSERYVPSDMVADYDEEYTVYYAFDTVTGQICAEGYETEAVYIVISVDGGEEDAWVCRSYPAAPEEYRLKRNRLGFIEDTAKNITRYCEAAEMGKFDFNYYFIYILSNEYRLPDSELEELRYKDNLYLPVRYNETADTVLLEESAFITEGINSDKTVPCTLFRVKEDRSIVAVFYNGELHYFGLA
ncbi:MAG: hypothetical protein K2N36_06580 [Ruminiclostridium sp.]|nr:hypothetical protein [Ruminiclostridium sp.]